MLNKDFCSVSIGVFTGLMHHIECQLVSWTLHDKFIVRSFGVLEYLPHQESRPQLYQYFQEEKKHPIEFTFKGLFSQRIRLVVEEIASWGIGD